MKQEKDSKLFEINEEINKLTENIYENESEQRDLIRTEDELHTQFRNNKLLFEDLKSSWKHGEMRYHVQDAYTELKHHERKMTQALGDEMHQLKQKSKFFKEKESELQTEIKLLSMEDY